MDRRHDDRAVLRRVTDDLAQLTPLASAHHHVGLHLGGVELDAVGLRAIHDAKPTALLGYTALVVHIRNVIHAPVLPFLLFRRQPPQFATKAAWVSAQV